MASTLNDQVNAGITEAMKAKNTVRLSALRMLKAAIMNKGVEKGRDLGRRRESCRSSARWPNSAATRSSSSARPDARTWWTRNRRSSRARGVPAGGRIGRRHRSRRHGGHRRDRRHVRPRTWARVMKAVMPKLAGKTADGRAVNEAVRRALGA
jgi:hypothetical protein